MNRITTTIVCIFAGLFAVNHVAAQRHSVRVIIPFDFTASGAQLSAGSYTIASQNGFTWITNDGTQKSTFVTAIGVADTMPDESKVIFSSYGDKHVLRKILCPGVNMSLELLPSKHATKAQPQLASNSGE